MIPQELLKNYQGRALSIGAYGVGGMEKSLAARTLVPPILLLDFEGGSGCLGPWTRRIRKSTSTEWLNYDDGDRQRLLNLVSKENLVRAIYKPAPWVDIISFDDLLGMADNGQGKNIVPAYDEAFKVISNFNYEKYNSLAIDPLVEFSQATQSQAKIVKGQSTYTPMEVQYWQGAQERASILLRCVRGYRDKGIFVYMTSSEFIDKDYGTDPRSKTPGAASEEPYAIKGQINLPGKLVAAVNHMLDIQCHARMMNSLPVWVTKEEPARSGSFNWDAKDRTGRLAETYIKPNIRTIIESVYGKEAQKEIYEYAKAQTA